MSLALHICTPDGQRVDETGLDVVVLRRREPRFDRGSEVAVFPGHAPLLMRIPGAPLRYRAADRVVELEVKAGFAQIRDDEVLVLTSGFVSR